MSAGGALIPLVAGVLGIGVIAQVLAARFRVPSVIFLIAAGLVLGPLTHVITLSTFGTSALSAIVGLSVAIIVFEGAFHLKLPKLREAPAATLNLVTVGALVSFAGTTAAVHVFVGAPWSVAALVGALLVATGPTVIAPILAVVPVRDRVAAALETEGIVNDVSAAVLAVVIFEAIKEGITDPGALARLYASTLGTGVLVGLVVAAVVYYALAYVDFSPGNAPQLARLLTLAGALVAYAAASDLMPEAGVAAAATAGLVLGNLDVPYEAEIEAFKGDVTLLVLSFVFVALAALLNPTKLLALGLGGLAVVLAVTVVVRPLLVFVSMRGGRFTRAEKLFVSFVGPRGIIPASVATLFALDLRSTGTIAVDALTESARLAAADTVVGTVFLVILATVVFEAGLARPLAEYLDVLPMRVLVIGGGKVGRSLAERLEERGENVVLIERNPDVVERARNDGFTVHRGDGTDTDVLRAAGADNAKIVVAATGDDDVNLLVAQLSASKFDVEEIIARANNPDNVDAFEDLGVRTISSTDATAWAIDNAIERPALANWMTELGRAGDVQEIEVTSQELVGRTIREIGPELPGGCLVALVSRDGESFVPDADFTLQSGDHLTILGRREAVREAMAFCHPEE